MKGFVLACGRSGTMWVAAALSEAAMLDARHESCNKWDPFASFGEVEVNSFLWHDVPEIRQRFRDARIYHLVRDGRDVVRSIMNRPRPGRTLQVACEMWSKRNRFLARHVPIGYRYKMEHLTSKFHYLDEFARGLGSPYVRRWVWDRMREEKVNRNTEGNGWPGFNDWSPRNKEIFRKVCGEEMERMGYVD